MVVKSSLSYKNYKQLNYINSDLFPINWESEKSEPNDFVASLVKSGLNIEDAQKTLESSVSGEKTEFSEFLEEKSSSEDMSVYDIVVSIFFGMICAIGLLSSVFILVDTLKT